MTKSPSGSASRHGRVLLSETNPWEFNAWDNVQWDSTRIAEAEASIQRQRDSPVPDEMIGKSFAFLLIQQPDSKPKQSTMPVLQNFGIGCMHRLKTRYTRIKHGLVSLKLGIPHVESEYSPNLTAH